LVKLTFLWQHRHFPERDWIARLFEPFAGEQVYDGEHKIVLDNCLVIDACLHCHPRAYFEQFRGKNAFLLHLCEETYEGGYHHYDNFRGVFRCYWSGIFNPLRVMAIPLGYQAGFTGSAGELGTARRPYLWSFLGAGSKSSRPEMIKALMPLTPHFLRITDRGKVEHVGKPEYEQILRDSIFVPSSMGNVNLECYRIYEALECGAIPIIERRIGFDYFTHLLGRHPLPSFTNWGQAARFVDSMREDRAALDRLQMECVDWWDGYKQTLTQRIERFIDAPTGEEAGSSVRWTRSIPGSQAFELMRHHSMPALGRRVRMQLRRLMQEGKLRKTEGA
jgi:hypothetical protein